MRYFPPRVYAVFLWIVFGGFAAALSLAAQETSGDTGEDWVRPDREVLRGEILSARASAPDMRTKLAVVAEIRDKARSGGVSPEDKSVLGVLRYLAGEGTLSFERGPASAPQGFPEVRRDSCETLGYIGGEAAREILLAVLRAEGEPMVLSQAVAALGRITGQPDEEIIAAFTLLLETRVLVPGADNNLAMALIETLQKFAASKEGVHDVNLFRALMRIPDAPLAPSVRRRARILIEKMKGF